MRVSALAVSPGGPRALLAGTLGQGVFRSEDGGGSFAAWNGGLRSLLVRDLAFDPAEAHLVFAAAGRGGLSGLERGGVHRSDDGGRTWRLVAPAALAVAVAPSQPEVVYAGGPPVLKSVDRGLTWADPTTGARVTDVEVRALAVSPANPDLVLAGGVTEGGSGLVFRSADGGASWQRVLAPGDGVNDLAFANGDVAFLATGTVGAEAGVWRSQDAGRTWQRVTAADFGNVVAHAVLVNPLYPRLVYAATTGRGVIRSTDGGDRWLELNDMLGTTSALSLAIERTTPWTLYAGTQDGVWALAIAETRAVAPRVVLAPSRALAGERIRVRAEGFSGHPAAGTTQCVGLRGPAQNLAFELAPAFNLHLATIALDQAGQGETAATLPLALPPGPYQVIVGGCQLQRGIAPLAGPATELAVGAQTLYFAEGSTQPGFETWYLLQNPHAGPVRATLTLLEAGGAARAFSRQLPPSSRTSVPARALLPGQAISARVDAEQPIFAERAMYFGQDGHVSPALPAPARRWLLAEGSSQADFQTWILVQNPTPEPAEVHFTFQLPDGGTRTHEVAMPPTSRFSLLANEVVPNAAFSTVVESNVPVVVERAMYTGTPGAPTGGHGVPGTTTPSTLWQFAEGSSQPSLPDQDFQTFLLLHNPNPRPVAATIRLLRDDGTSLVQPLALTAGARLTFHANLALPGEAFGIRVEADEPLVAERVMFFGPEAGASHATLGALAPATRWHLAEGSTLAPFETWVLVANPNAEATEVRLRFNTEAGRVVEASRSVGASSRATFLVNELVPDEAGVSTQVQSTLPVVVERSVYFDDRRGGTNTIGIVP